MDKIFNKIANAVSRGAGQPAAFAAALAFIIVWALSGPLFGFSDTWQLVVNTSTTIITFLMVFIIQNSQNRDSAALQAKLDELLRALKGARTEFVGIEHLTDKELELLRSKLEAEVDATKKGGPMPAHETVAHLLSR